MRLKSLFIVVMLFVAMMAQAQSLQEVVYLKNGSVIRGVIIEQVPNESLKIQTSDGSIFAYQMDEVEKITKEEVKKEEARKVHSVKKPLFNGDGKGPKKGYRGFVDVNYTIGVGGWGQEAIGATTSHGYQFNHWLFVGIGLGVQHYSGFPMTILPMFLHFRSELLNHSISPFIEFKVGASVDINKSAHYKCCAGNFCYVCDNDIEAGNGFYMMPAVGCRVAIGKMYGVSLSVGYVMQRFQRDYTYYISDGVTTFGKQENCGGVIIKAGFDF